MSTSANLRRWQGVAQPLCALTLLAFLAACAPTVRVEAPDKPIEINLNVKIEHEIRVKVDEDLDELFEDEGGNTETVAGPILFGADPHGHDDHGHGHDHDHGHDHGHEAHGHPAPAHD